MTVSLIVYGIYATLFGLSLSTLLAIFKQAKIANVIMTLATLVGFLSGVAYFLICPGKEIEIAQYPFFWNFKFVLNFLSAIFFTVLTGISCLVSVYGYEYLDRYRKTYDINAVVFLVSLFILGMAGVLLSSNAIGFIIFWEIMSFSSFFLVMADKTHESARAAFIYFIMTHLGAAAILGGFLVLSHGNLGFGLNDVFAATKDASTSVISLSFALFFFGFGSKAGLIPFHIWLPEAHPQAPTNVSALMSGVMLKIALYGFLRVILAYYQLPTWAAYVVIISGISSALFGALYAVIIRDIKKTFAYSSIENMGIMFTMVGVALYLHIAKLGIGAEAIYISLISYAIFHAINHAIFKTGLFLSSGIIINKTHTRRIEEMGGVAKMMPFFSLVFLVVIIGSTALPPFGTFFGEWGFVRSLINLLQLSGPNVNSVFIFLAVLSLFALVSGLAIFAMVRVYGMTMLALPRTNYQEHQTKGNDAMLVWPIAVMGILIVLSGIFAKNILNIISANVNSFTGETVSGVVQVVVSSYGIFIIFAAFGLLSFVAYKLLSRNGGAMREYQTWDCGQPIDASMEYSATAFSGPIRFFFLGLIQRKKTITSVPVVATNPWIANKSFSMGFTSAWHEKFYKPTAKLTYWLADKIRLIHTGRVQYYLLLLFVTIIITLIIAL